jgi:adenine-specific DNA-methyltransferase
LYKQEEFFDEDSIESRTENPGYLSTQVITCIGNKRTLLGFIGEGIRIASKKLSKDRVRVFDVFSGSGIVSRYLKQFAEYLIANDCELYSETINKCYLSNASEIDISLLKEIYTDVKEKLKNKPLRSGFITDLYAPDDDHHIKPYERVFYTNRNARYIDTARQYIGDIPKEMQHCFIAPLLSEASIHANTAGVFKGFYKNSKAGIGQFGGNNGDALSRIKGDIDLPFPVFSRYECETKVYREDANKIAAQIDEVDIAYLDPPYNQHPYGSNYFMLNLITTYQRPHQISEVSGIPQNWIRSDYNKAHRAAGTLFDLLQRINAKFLLISFNSEGFISRDSMTAMLGKIGRVTTLETTYNTFRGSRNLRKRDIHVKEYVYLVEKR